VEAKRVEPLTGDDEPAANVHFVVERAYEEALSLLWAARQRAPDIAEIARGIQLLKQRLVRRYLCHLGDLDRVPCLLVDANALDEFNLEPEELEIVRLVDGVSSYGDIIVESRFGRLETYRRLAWLLARGIIIADSGVVLAEATPMPVAEKPPLEPALILDDEDVPVAAAPACPEPEPEAVIVAARNHHLWWLVAALLVVAAGAGVMWWMESLWAPRAAVPAAAPAPVAVAATVTVPVAATVTVPVAAPETAPAAADTAADTAPATAAATATDTAPATAAATATATDTATATATDTAPAPAPAPPPRATTTTTRKPPPPKPSRSVSPPSRDVVDQTLARIEPAFRSCYAAARRTGPVRVSLTIDESGAAHDLETDPGSAPALIDCVRGKSDRLHRGEAPAALGVARVSFTVTE